MNRAIAVAQIDGPEAGLAVLDRLDLDHYRYFHSTRAELRRRADRDDQAHHASRRALDLAQTKPEQRFLAARPAETTSSVRKEPGRASTDGRNHRRSSDCPQTLNAARGHGRA